MFEDPLDMNFLLLDQEERIDREAADEGVAAREENLYAMLAERTALFRVEVNGAGIGVAIERAGEDGNGSGARFWRHVAEMYMEERGACEECARDADYLNGVRRNMGNRGLVKLNVPRERLPEVEGFNMSQAGQGWLIEEERLQRWCDSPDERKVLDQRIQECRERGGEGCSQHSTSRRKQMNKERARAAKRARAKEEQMNKERARAAKRARAEEADE